MEKFEKDWAKVLEKVANDFTSVEVKSELFPVGKHKALIVKVSVISSFHNVDGTLKEKDWEWKTPNPVIAITYANDGKAIMHRYHVYGYRKYDELKPEEKESGKYEPSDDGFAIINGDREPSQEHTAACTRIISGVFRAAGLPAGSKLVDLQKLIDERSAEVMITVKEKEAPDGTVHKVVSSVGKVAVEAPVGEEYA